MANFNFNKVIIGGRLTSDPELKTTPSGVSVTNFSVAVNKKSGEEQQADYFNVQAWRGTAEFITKFFKKGSSICIVGEIHNRKWTDNDGVKHYATEIDADEAFFVDSKGEAPAPIKTAKAELHDPYANEQKFEEIDDESLPF